MPPLPPTIPQPPKTNAAVFFIPPLVIVIIALLVYIASNPTTQTTTTATPQASKTPTAGTLNAPTAQKDLTSIRKLAENDLAYSVGPKDAKVTLVTFVDFQCPFCRQTAPTITDLIKKYDGKSVRFIFRHFPLASIHPYAIVTAQGAICAREQDKFLPMHDLLYKEQDTISVQLPYTAAKELNLDMQKFTTCMSSDAYKTTLTKDITDGLDLGVAGTPTFFINGQKLAGVVAKETFEATIDAELSRAKK